MSALLRGRRAHRGCGERRDRDRVTEPKTTTAGSTDEALTAFHHPYAYAAAKGVPYQ
jgi:hypothetical protein